jgi:hypothetical protein
MSEPIPDDYYKNACQHLLFALGNAPALFADDLEQGMAISKLWKEQLFPEGAAGNAKYDRATVMEDFKRVCTFLLEKITLYQEGKLPLPEILLPVALPADKIDHVIGVNMTKDASSFMGAAYVLGGFDLDKKAFLADVKEWLEKQTPLEDETFFQSRARLRQFFLACCDRVKEILKDEKWKALDKDE